MLKVRFMPEGDIFENVELRGQHNVCDIKEVIIPINGAGNLVLHIQFCSTSSRPIFTESQNHRIVGVGKNLWGSSSPIPLPKQGHLQQAAQDLVQEGLEYLQRRRIHNLPGQPVPVLRHAQGKEVVPRVIWNFPCLSLYLLQLVLLLGTTEKGLAPSS